MKEHHGLGLYDLGGYWGAYHNRREINRKHYDNILHDSLTMSVVKFGNKAEEWVFQHDNDLKHTNMSTIMKF